MPAHTVIIFFLIRRTFKVHFLSNLQIRNTGLLTTVTVLHITSPGFIYLITTSLDFLTTFTHFSHSPNPASDNHQSVLWFYEFSVSDPTHKWDHMIFICLWLSSFRALGSPQGPATFLQRTRFSSFYDWILFQCLCMCVCGIISLSVNLLIDMYVVSLSWLW